jgi:hypothetical protein
MLTDTFQRIDAIRSTSGMENALRKLDEVLRKDVILFALRNSRFQFHWSFFAEQYGIPENEWPDADKSVQNAR